MAGYIGAILFYALQGNICHPCFKSSDLQHSGSPDVITIHYSHIVNVPTS